MRGRSSAHALAISIRQLCSNSVQNCEVDNVLCNTCHIIGLSALHLPSAWKCIHSERVALMCIVHGPKNRFFSKNETERSNFFFQLLCGSWCGSWCGMSAVNTQLHRGLTDLKYFHCSLQSEKSFIIVIGTPDRAHETQPNATLLLIEREIWMGKNF